MSNDVTILMGPSGSGKSTWIEDEPTGWRSTDIVSSDGYPGLYLDDGSMDFSLLGKAHQSCMRSFIGFLQGMRHFGQHFIVDNTNTTVIELAPYIAVAQSYGITPKIQVFGIKDDLAYDEEYVDILTERNRHQVPREVIVKQLDHLAATLASWPPFWPEPEYMEV